MVHLRSEVSVLVFIRTSEGTNGRKKRRFLSIGKKNTHTHTRRCAGGHVEPDESVHHCKREIRQDNQRNGCGDPDPPLLQFMITK